MAIPAESLRRPDMRELGLAGTKIYAGLISEEDVPALQGDRALKVWRQMRFDPTGAALLKATELPIRSARWFMEPGSDDPRDIELADFCHDTLWTFGSQSFDDALRLAFGMMWAGFSPLEIVYKYFEDGQWKGKVGWDKLAWRNPVSKWRWIIDEVNGRREFGGMVQLAPPYYDERTIPANKMLLFVHNLEGENFDGVSLFRAAYKSWFIRDQLYRIQAIGLERNYMGIPVVSIENDFSDEQRDLAKQIVTTVRTDEQAGVVKPHDMAFEWLHSPLQGDTMQKAIEHHDTQIVASGLADMLKLGSRSVGSFALSADKTDLFLYAINAEANYASEVFNLEPGLPTLLRYNYANLQPQSLPRLSHGDIGNRPLERLGRTLMALGQWGFLTPDDQTEDKLRQMLDLPEREYDYDDRDLWGLIQEVRPVEDDPRANPKELARLYPKPGLPVPTDADGQPVPPKPVPANMAEAWDRYLVQQAKVNDVVRRNRWRRPKGRMDAETRMRVQLAETLTETLDDVSSRVGLKPERPSVRMAKLRRPYVVRPAMPHKAPQADSRMTAVARRHVPALQQALKPKV